MRSVRASAEAPSKRGVSPMQVLHHDHNRVSPHQPPEQHNQQLTPLLRGNGLTQCGGPTEPGYQRREHLPTTQTDQINASWTEFGGQPGDDLQHHGTNDHGPGPRSTHRPCTPGPSVDGRRRRDSRTNRDFPTPASPPTRATIDTPSPTGSVPATAEIIQPSPPGGPRLVTPTAVTPSSRRLTAFFVHDQPAAGLALRPSPKTR